MFITHCGMNSVNEALYYGVPMVLFPQHSEQGLVAERVAELGAGIKLKGNKPRNLAEAVARVIGNASYYENAKKLSEGFRKSGGAVGAANVIVGKIGKNSMII